MKTNKKDALAHVVENALQATSATSLIFNQYGKQMQLHLGYQDNMYSAELSTLTTKQLPRDVVSGNTETVINYLAKRITVPCTMELLEQSFKMKLKPKAKSKKQDESEIFFDGVPF